MVHEKGADVAMAMAAPARIQHCGGFGIIAITAVVLAAVTAPCSIVANLVFLQWRRNQCTRVYKYKVILAFYHQQYLL
jgi:hypothetical protein